jgi:hypothetical protein
MTFEAIERDFKKRVCEKLRVEPEGVNRFRVFTPFMFEDGDHLAIILKRIGESWVLSDEGHTYMRLTYDLDEKDFARGTRQKIITNALSSFSVSDEEGELLLRVPDEQYGDALYSFVQALLRVADVSYLNRERVRSTFMEDFRTLIEETVPKERRTFDWHDPKLDPEGKYVVDCKVNNMERPLFLYALQSDDKVRDATIGLLQFERLKTQFRAVGIFDDQEQINRKVLARFSDVCDKQFSSLASNRDRIARYLRENLQTIQ